MVTSNSLPSNSRLAKLVGANGIIPNIPRSSFPEHEVQQLILTHVRTGHMRFQTYSLFLYFPLLWLFNELAHNRLANIFRRGYVKG